MEKASELREMSDEQLELTLKEAAENLFRLRLQAETERSAAPSELRKSRRLIARVKTIQGERRRAAVASIPAAKPVAAPAPPAIEAKPAKSEPAKAAKPESAKPAAKPAPAKAGQK